LVAVRVKTLAWLNSCYTLSSIIGKRSILLQLMSALA
jgi:hypothetical protein